MASVETLTRNLPTEEELRELLGNAARLLPPLPSSCAVLASAREDSLAQGESVRQAQVQETCQSGGRWQPGAVMQMAVQGVQPVSSDGPPARGGVRANDDFAARGMLRRPVALLATTRDYLRFNKELYLLLN